MCANLLGVSEAAEGLETSVKETVAADMTLQQALLGGGQQQQQQLSLLGQEEAGAIIAPLYCPQSCVDMETLARGVRVSAAAARGPTPVSVCLCLFRYVCAANRLSLSVWPLSPWGGCLLCLVGQPTLSLATSPRRFAPAPRWCLDTLLPICCCCCCCYVQEHLNLQPVQQQHASGPKQQAVGVLVSPCPDVGASSGLGFRV